MAAEQAVAGPVLGLQLAKRDPGEFHTERTLGSAAQTPRFPGLRRIEAEAAPAARESRSRGGAPVGAELLTLAPATSLARPW